MNSALIGVVGLVFLAVGLSIGLYLRQVGVARACLQIQSDPLDFLQTCAGMT